MSSSGILSISKTRVYRPKIPKILYLASDVKHFPHPHQPYNEKQPPVVLTGFNFTLSIENAEAIRLILHRQHINLEVIIIKYNNFIFIP